MNNMKKIHSILFTLITGLLLFTACNNDFLDRSPLVDINDGAVWKTPDHLKLYVNNFYNQNALLPRYDGYRDYVYQQDANSGSDTHDWYDSPNTRLDGRITLPTTGGGWTYDDWSVLRNINYFFAHYTNATGDTALINRYVGEAFFFRSLFYFDKVRRFGNVPWYDNLLTMGDNELLHKARDPRNAVIQHLMDDLDNAVQYLPSRTDATWKGRVNKETAMLLQARIALYEGTWEKYHSGTAFGVDGSDGSVFLNKAGAVTDALIASDVCDLDNMDNEAGYYDLFNQTSYASSREVLFWREYKLSISQHRWSCYTSTGAGMGLTKRMVDYYLDTDGKPIELSDKYKGDTTLLAVVTDRDPRLNQTIYVADGKRWHKRRMVAGSDFTNPMFAGEREAHCPTGYQICKGHNPKYFRGDFGDWCDQGVIYFRYAEALLINAEAKAELGTITQSDLDKTVNKLRDRVGMAHLILSDVTGWGGAYKKQFPTLSNIINEIRRERTVELVAEGFRVDDILRWAAADELIKGYTPLGAKKAQWDGSDDPMVGNISALGTIDGYINYYSNHSVGQTGYGFDLNRDYLLPLPIEELVLNPNLKPNNPGWGDGK
jgi:hypothetical protein